MLYSILDDEGNLDWEFDAGGEIQGTPAILMNIEGSKQYEKIVFGTDSAKVYALNTNRGDLNWSFNTGGESVKGSPLISHGVVYIGTMSGTLIALDEDGFHDGDQGFDDSNEAKTRGDLLWNLTLTDPIRSAPVIMDDTIVLVTTKTDSSKIIAMDRESQSIQWSYEFDSSTLGSPIINPESGQVYLGTNDNFMYALDIQGLANGNQGLDTEDLAKSVNADIIWKFDSKGKITTTGAIDTEDDRLVFCTEDGYVYALPIDNFNEEESWKFHINGKISASPTIAMDYVYVGSENGILYCLSEFRGDFSSKNTSLLWTFDAGSAVLAPPIVDNFATYVATRDGIIHKLGAPNQPPSAIIDLPYINQTFFVEDHITLDASSSFDLEDRTNLKYIWYFSTAKDPPEFKVLYNYTSNSLVSVEINDTIKLAGDYIINLTVIDSYDSFAFNTTKITIYDPVIRIYNNQSIPSSCRIYFSGNGGIDLYATSDPNYISGNDQSGSVGDIDQFVNLFYSTFKPLYKVGWYNVSVGYKSDDLPEGYNVSRVRMYNYNQNTGSWNKQTNTGIDLDDRLVWANLTGDKITPMNEQLFAPGTFDNSPPTLNIIDNGVKPLNGSKDIEFEYLFEYTDENNDLPITANGGYVKIEINGWKYSMKETNKNDTDVTDGKYFNFSIKGKKLDPVSNNFRIYIHDGTYLVKSSLRQGPSVAFGKPPTARAGDDKTVTVGEHFELDASGSTDPDGNSNIELYLWDTNNDGDFNESGGSKQGMVTTWVFDEVGVYTITLLVLDKEGNPDTDTITITVNPKEKDDETKEDNSYLMLIGAVLVLIIIILLIIILIFMRKKEQSERERKAFVIDEEEEEEELEEDEGEEDEDLEDEDEESEDEDVEEGEEEEEGEKDEMDDEESEDEEDEELEGEEEDEEDLEVDEEFEEDFEEEFEEEPPEMESDELEEELDEPVESEVEPKELELEPETEEPVSEEEPIAEGSDQKEPAEEDTESKANEHEKKHMDKEIKTKKKMKTKSIKKSLKSKGLKKIKKKK
jgi:outer membrane protein assembly factor BamB